MIKLIIKRLYNKIKTEVQELRRYKYKRWIKFKKQELAWGFSEIDTWAMDYSLSKQILPRLKKFKEIHCGIPSFLYPHYKDHYTDEEHKIASEKWKELIDKMIRAFELILMENDEYLKYSTFNQKELQKEIDHGLRLFSKHFQNLWW